MNKHVAVFCKDQSVFEDIKQASKSLLIIHHHPELAALEDPFVVTDTESYLEIKNQLKKVNADHIYVLSKDDDETNMKFIEKYEIYHLIGLNEGIFAQELVANITKSANKKIWGLNSYIDDEAKIEIISLSDSKQTNEMIQSTLSHFDFKDYFSSPTEYIQVMANELISNSLYKGPNKKRLEQGLEKHDRKSPVFLKGSELVQVSIGMDSKGIALSVQDSFGGLSYELLIETLKRSFKEKTAMEKKDGAGLGLYLTFLHSNQFIINYKKDFRTEVICIIDKNKRYKNYKQRIRSFHFFQEVTSEKINA